MNNTYTLTDYQEFSRALTRSIEDEKAFSKIYDKLEDIDLSIAILRTEYRERNNKDYSNKSHNVKEYNIDDFEDYCKAPTKFVRNMKKMCADDDNTVRFCEMVLSSIDFVKSVSHTLKGVKI